MNSVKRVRKARHQYYGDAKKNHDTVGLMFTGLLERHYEISLPHPVPGHVVALMMAAVKLNRAATPLKFNPDNYLDGCAYVEIARDIDERNKK